MFPFPCIHTPLTLAPQSPVLNCCHKGSSIPSPEWAPQNQPWICIAGHFPLLLSPKGLSTVYTASSLTSCSLHCQHFPLKAPMPLVLSIFLLATNFWGRISWQNITCFVTYPTSAVLCEGPGLPWELETQTSLWFLCICTGTTPSSRPAYARRATKSIGNRICLPVGPLCVSPWATPFIGLVSHPFAATKICQNKCPLRLQTTPPLPSPNPSQQLSKGKGVGSKEEMEGEREWLIEFLGTFCILIFKASRSPEDASALLLWFSVNS